MLQCFFDQEIAASFQIAHNLLGMALLRGYEYRMELRAKGKITIERLPQGRRKNRHEHFART
jgi:hypothetical protein